MNLYWIRTIIFIIFFSACYHKKNSYNGAYEIVKSIVSIDKINNGKYFLIMPEGKGCEVCNIHFVSKFKKLSKKKNLIIISNNFNLPKTPNFYLDSSDKISNSSMGFIGTALLIKKNNQFEKILSLDANTIDKLDSIINLIE
jgi:thioredoxin-related protein